MKLMTLVLVVTGLLCSMAAQAKLPEVWNQTQVIIDGNPVTPTPDSNLVSVRFVDGDSVIAINGFVAEVMVKSVPKAYSDTAKGRADREAFEVMMRAAQRGGSYPEIAAAGAQVLREHADVVAEAVPSKRGSAIWVRYHDGNIEELYTSNVLFQSATFHEVAASYQRMLDNGDIFIFQDGRLVGIYDQKDRPRLLGIIEQAQEGGTPQDLRIPAEAQPVFLQPKPLSYVGE
ncbi:MAG: hypothetical protein Q8Q20_01515 [bacterium]|nr:hypothetical protein [bacterium]